jgi:thiamine biosynthesis lipoprotein
MKNAEFTGNSCQGRKRVLPSPRFLPILASLTLVLYATLLSSRCTAPPARWFSATFFVFDTVCDLRLYCPKATWRTAQEDIHLIFDEIDRLFSPDGSALASEPVLDLFNRAGEIHRQTDGLFDISVAPLTRLWGFWDGRHRVPGPAEIRLALRQVGLEKIRWVGDSLIIPPGAGLDWGGIAKGFGIDQAARAMKEKGVSRGFINAGGDLSCWGENPSQQAWRVGIKHPRREGFLGVLELSETAAATSGDYQRFFIHEGKRFHHIFNPRTGYPARGKQSVTVIGPEALVCDALSTALFISTNPEQILAEYPDYGAVMMDDKGKISTFGKNYPFQPSPEGLKE